jgi:hypothetical protein
MNPFEIQDATVNEWPAYSIPVLPEWIGQLNYTWKAAFYVFPYRSLPIWYQVNLKVNKELIYHLRENAEVTLEGGFLTLERVLYERPIVAWGE